MNVRIAAIFSFVSVIFASAAAFACPPSPSGFTEFMVFSGILASLHVIAYGVLTAIYLTAIGGRQHLSFGQGVKYWFGSLLVAYVAGSVGNLAGFYIGDLIHEAAGFVFAVTFPLVALAGYFTRIERGTPDRLAKAVDEV